MKASIPASWAKNTRLLTASLDACAQCGSIRVTLLKIGAQMRISVRRVWVSFSESYPYVELFRRILDNLRGSPPVLSAARALPAASLPAADGSH